MSNRRRMLMAIVNNYKWLPYSYEYLYNSLIPETISSKGVKNKAKVSKIYANGVVENQIVQNGDFSLNSGWYAIGSVYSFNISNNTMTATKTTIGTNLFCYKSNDYVPLQPNHKYLCVAQCKASSNCRVRFRASVGGTTKTLSANTTTLLTDFITTGSSISGIYCGLQEVEESSFPTLPVGGTIETKEYRMFDLTLMFGTGNEPTTLTDNRIQAILNRGYIAYNTGTYKGTDISEFSSETYNLFDGELEVGAIFNNGSDSSNSTVLRSKNWVKVQPNKSYKFDVDSSLRPSGIFIYGRTIENDSSTGRFLTVITTQSYTMPSDINYVRFSLPQSETAVVPSSNTICVHNSSINLGYKPHQTFSPLSFIYQGNGALNSHDTFEITSTEYVFTKNVGSYTFAGSETWNAGTGGYGWALYGFVLNNGAKANSSNNLIPNIQFEKYANATPTNIISQIVDKAISYNISGSLLVRDTSIISATDMASAMSGKTIYYELATPQVIRIPKKHLGIVDLGSLNWSYQSEQGRFLTDGLTGLLSTLVGTSNIGKLYCSKYMNVSYDNLGSSNNCICQYPTQSSYNRVFIKDSSYTSPTDFKQAMSGIYLFYETENEVVDIADTIGIEKGGTITSNWFGYISNQLVQNGNFVSTSGYSSSQNSLSVADNVLTILIGSPTSAGLVANILVYSNVSVVSGHKYLITAQVKPPVNGSCAIKGTYDSFPEIRSNITINTWNDVYGIATATNSQSVDMQFNIYNTEVIRANDSFYLKNFMFIDLTLAFGSGKEPSTIDDPRVQYILGLGYIPFDATGTRTGVPSPALPNVDFNIKCK